MVDPSYFLEEDVAIFYSDSFGVGFCFDGRRSNACWNDRNLPLTFLLGVFQSRIGSGVGYEESLRCFTVIYHASNDLCLGRPLWYLDHTRFGIIPFAVAGALAGKSFDSFSVG